MILILLCLFVEFVYDYLSPMPRIHLLLLLVINKTKIARQQGDNLSKYECQFLKGTVKTIAYIMLQGLLKSPFFHGEL